MTLASLISNYADYNAWANQTLVAWLSAKPAEVLSAPTQSSFPSLVKTLNHILAVEEFWLSVIEEAPTASSRYGMTEFDPKEVMESLLAHSERFSAYVKGLSEEELSKTIYLKTPWFESDLPRGEYIMHAVNHGTYHRGQLTSMGHQVGLHDAPMSDYNFYNLAKMSMAAPVN